MAAELVQQQEPEQEKKQKEKVYIAVDIERTGKFQEADHSKGEKGDVTFAIGFAVGNVESGVIERHSFALNLHKDKATPWEEHWKESGHEERCWKWWSETPKKLATLNNLQDPTKIKMFETQAEFSAEINRLLGDIEERYESDGFVSDTLCFDMVHIGHLLTMYGFLPINYQRKGSYIWGFEADSYLRGAAGTSKYDIMSEFQKHVSGHFQPDLGDTEHDHDPGNDAATILAQFIGTLAYCDLNLGKFKRPQRPENITDEKWAADKKQHIDFIETMIVNKQEEIDMLRVIADEINGSP